MATGTATVNDPGVVVVGSLVTRALVVVMVALIAAIASGLVVMWPHAATDTQLADAIAPAALFDGRVVHIARGPCEGTDPTASASCTVARVRLEAGPDRGRTIELPEEADAEGARLDRGEQIVVAYYPDAGRGFEYAYVDRERRTPLVALALVVVVGAIVVGLWKGMRSLLAIGVSLGVVGAFVVPALLDGRNPTMVALVGGGAIVVLGRYLVDGINVRTTVAIIGTSASLAAVGALAWAFVAATHLTGESTAAANFLQLASGRLNLRGLVLAAIVIGTIGVLQEVTVRQVSAVWDLRRTIDGRSRLAIYRGAMGTGREHLGSAMNTLVLAYAGASLPLFLLLTQSSQRLSDTVNSEVLGVEIVRALVGSLGLIASVPLTTLLATVVVSVSVSVSGRDRAAPRDDPRRYRNRHERELWESAISPTPPTTPPQPDRAI